MYFGFQLLWYDVPFQGLPFLNSPTYLYPLGETIVSFTTDLHPVRGSISNKMKTKINFLLEQINGMGFINRRFFIKFSFDEFLVNQKK